MIDKDDVLAAVEVLRSGGTILYPTDTLWGIGCDATQARAVQKVIRIKKSLERNGFIILLDDPARIPAYVTDVVPTVWALIENLRAPTTIVYPRAKNLPKNVMASDGSIGIRIVRDDFCREMIRLFGKPIVSSSANLSGDPTPITFREIREEILKGVDYAVKSERDKLIKVKASTILRVREDGEFDVIRQ